MQAFLVKVLEQDVIAGLTTSQFLPSRCSREQLGGRDEEELEEKDNNQIETANKMLVEGDAEADSDEIEPEPRIPGSFAEGDENYLPKEAQIIWVRHRSLRKSKVREIVAWWIAGMPWQTVPPLLGPRVPWKKKLKPLKHNGRTHIRHLWPSSKSRVRSDHHSYTQDPVFFFFASRDREEGGWRAHHAFALGDGARSGCSESIELRLSLRVALLGSRLKPLGCLFVLASRYQCHTERALRFAAACLCCLSASKSATLYSQQ